MDKKEKIRNAYRELGGDRTFYDGMITCSTIPGKMVCRLVWGMGREDCLEYLSQALSGIPEGFKGKLLEVPVGTGVLTMPFYRELPEAKIHCLDYSEEMLQRAKARGAELDNVHFLQGDVGALPFEDNSFDLVVSLNGFHAFPDKEAAWKEIYRVLKPGGTFCGCFYVQGENGRTDRFIRKLYEPKGFFTPPFDTVQSLNECLQKMYGQVRVNTVQSIATFCCQKKKDGISPI